MAQIIFRIEGVVKTVKGEVNSSEYGNRFVRVNTDNSQWDIHRDCLLVVKEGKAAEED